MESFENIPVFRPTSQEFKEFASYIRRIEEQGANEVGLCKIIPPEGWSPRKGGYDNLDIVIPAPIKQSILGRAGIYKVFSTDQKPMSLQNYEAMAKNPLFQTPTHSNFADLERKFWKQVKFNSTVYGADIQHSLFDDEVEDFAVPRLNTILDLVKQEYKISIDGITSPYLYFGMWKTLFPWHTEDQDLYSINYLHFGSQKIWYGIPPKHGKRFERFALSLYAHDNLRNTCPAYLRHKTVVISPTILKDNAIEFVRAVQEPREFIVTFPYAYHAGFNAGFNCAEATNFASERWVEYGKRATLCSCRTDSVRIYMDAFIKKYQPDRYKLWRSGNDIGCHPEEPSKFYPAPVPKKGDQGAKVQKSRKRSDFQVATTSEPSPPSSEPSPVFKSR